MNFEWTSLKEEEYLQMSIYFVFSDMSFNSLFKSTHVHTPLLSNFTNLMNYYLKYLYLAYEVYQRIFMHKCYIDKRDNV